MWTKTLRQPKGHPYHVPKPILEGKGGYEWVYLPTLLSDWIAQGEHKYEPILDKYFLMVLGKNPGCLGALLYNHYSLSDDQKTRNKQCDRIERCAYFLGGLMLTINRSRPVNKKFPAGVIGLMLYILDKQIKNKVK